MLFSYKIYFFLTFYKCDSLTIILIINYAVYLCFEELANIVGPIITIFVTRLKINITFVIINITGSAIHFFESTDSK